MTLQALLFDCDGVLVDTERDGHRVAFNRAFRDAGLDVEWSIEKYSELLLVAGGKERMTHFFEESSWPEGVKDKEQLIKDLHMSKTNAFMEIIASGSMSLRPGVRELITEATAEGIPVAVCSTSNVRAVQGIVDTMIGGDLAPYIKVFAGDMVRNKKPDPEIYLLGAQTLRVEPRQCVVVEDSHIGLSAAKAAGAHCIVTKSTYTQDEDFAAAEKVVSDLEQGGVNLETCRGLVAD